MSEQVAQLEAEVLRLSELLWGMRCIYCGEVVGKDKRNQDVAEAVLKAHIQQCDKHPVKALRDENQRLTQALRDCHMLARRASQKVHITVHYWRDIMRLCEYAGVTSMTGVLREQPAPPSAQGGRG